MPPGRKKHADTFLQTKSLKFLILSVLIGMSVFLNACTGEKKEQLDEKLTESAPVVSPMLSTDSQITSGNDFFLKGQFEDAIKYYEDGIAKNRSVAFYNIGVSYYLMGDIKKSEEAFRNSVAEDPGFREAYMNLAVVLTQTGQLAEAEKYVEKLLADESSSKLLVNMANIHLKKGETAKAAQYFKTAMDKGDSSKYVLSNYAYFLLAIGEYADGIKIIEGLQFKDYTDWFNLAQAYLNSGMHKAALEAASEAVRITKTEDALSLAAECYHALGDFYNEIRNLTFVISLNPDKEYIYRLVLAYYLDGKMAQAESEIKGLIAAHPDVHKYYRLYYEILIALGNISEAGDMANAAYKQFGTDGTIYTLVKHKIIYHEDVETITDKIFEDRTSPYLELARAVYYLHKDSMLKANEHILKVPAETDNDYYVIRSYILLRYGKYENALAFAKGISKVRPESFWYKMVAYFNTANLQGVQELLAEQVARKTQFIKASKVNFHIKPMMNDIHFSYRFDGTFEDILSVILYPLFIDPDEMMDFVALGYKMLQEDEKSVALKELERSVEYSDGIKLNNDGVALFLEYKFEEAFKKFDKANAFLNNNPYTLYNMGLSKLNLGDINAAARYFDTAVLQNNYHFPAYLGMAIVFREKGMMHKALDYYNLVRDRVVQAVEDKRKIPEPVLYSGFLAEMGFKGYTRVIDSIGDKKNDNAFLEAMTAIASYMRGDGFDVLEPLNTADDSIFRGQTIRDLLGTLDGEIVSYNQAFMNDRMYRFMKAYALLKKGAGVPEIASSDYPGDLMVLKELVYYNILMNNRDKALEYLQEMSNITIRSSELYKASLYYFMWVEDFVNAEASFTSLDHMKYTDPYVDYYKMLYFVLNYNGRRLLDSVKLFMKSYPDDIRGKMIRILYSLREEDFEIALNSINDMQKDEGNFLKKLPLELSIDGL